MKQVAAEVLGNEQVLPPMERGRGRSLGGAYVMRLRIPEMGRGIKPGQFVMVNCEGCALPRPLSIHRAHPDGISLFYVIWEQGRGTQWLSSKKPGDAVKIFGPLGNGFSLSRDGHNILLVAGGTGVAPLVYLADEAIKAGKDVRMLMGAATAGQLCPGEMIPGGAGISLCTEDGTAGHTGMVTEMWLDHSAWADQVFACGPLAMYRDMAERRVKLGLQNKAVQVSLEMRMGCGVGVCYSCTVKTRQGLKQVCKDGPVFDLDDLVWDGFTVI